MGKEGDGSRASLKAKQTMLFLADFSMGVTLINN
jgi:hypothetical protein